MDSELQNLKDALESAVAGMSAEQLAWHPADKWCAAEILEHLYLSYAGTVQGLERVMKIGRPLATHPTMKQRMQTLVVTGLGYMPEGRKAPAVARPKGLPAEEVRNNLAEKMEAMDAIIAQCEARFGGSVALMDHPILGPLTAPQWRKLHLVHGRHHHKQLLQRREASAAQ